MNAIVTPLLARVGQNFSQAAAQYDQHALAQRQSAQDLLPYVQTWQGRVLDVGCGTGWLTQQLLACEQISDIYALDIAAGMLQASALQHPRISGVQADAACLPMASASLSGVVSNFALQWLAQPEQFAAELARVLQPTGQFALALPVEGTLSELKQAWQGVEATVPVNTFHSVAQWQQALYEAGLQINVQAEQDYGQFYPDIRQLLASFKAIGAHEVQQPRRAGLWGIGQLRALAAAMEPYRTAQGLPLRYRVLRVVGVKK